MSNNQSLFRESVFELAFGDNAINKEYTEAEVLEKLRSFSDLALKTEAEEGADFDFTLCDETNKEEIIVVDHSGKFKFTVLILL